MSRKEAGAVDEGVQEFIDSIDPSTMRDAAHLRRIAVARTAVEAAEEELVEAIRGARHAGDSWTAIGMALRTSRQNAHRKYAPLAGEEGAGSIRSTSGAGADVEGEVIPSGAGGWDIVIAGSPSASAHFDTQAEAAARAREIIWGPAEGRSASTGGTVRSGLGHGSHAASPESGSLLRATSVSWSRPDTRGAAARACGRRLLVVATPPGAGRISSRRARPARP